MPLFCANNENYLYVFGGVDQRKNVCLQSIERLNLKNIGSEWELIEIQSEEHLIMCSSLVIRPEMSENCNKFVLFGGTFGSDSCVNDIVVQIEIKEIGKMEAITSKSTYWINSEEAFNNRI